MRLDMPGYPLCPEQWTALRPAIIADKQLAHACASSISILLFPGLYALLELPYYYAALHLSATVCGQQWPSALMTGNRDQWPFP